MKGRLVSRKGKDEVARSEGRLPVVSFSGRAVLIRDLVIVALLLTVIGPLVRLIPLTLLRWSDTDLEFTGPPSVDAYILFFQGHRGGIIIWNLLLAAVAVMLVFAIAVPVLVALRYFNEAAAIGAIEVAMVLPFLFSPALRLFSIRRLLTGEAALPQLLLTSGLSAEAVRSLMFSDIGIVIGLGLSFGALLVLPVSQSIKQIPQELFEASKDLGMNLWAVSHRLILPLAWRGMFAGATLMLTVAWFSSLEAEILGRRQSVLGMLRGLLAVKKYSESIAFAVITFAVATLMVILVAMIAKPESFFFPEEES